MLRVLWFFLLQVAVFAANSTLTLRVSNETAPAGGWAQIKIYAVPPAPIQFGGLALNLDQNVFGPVTSVSVFSASGARRRRIVLH